MHFELYFSSFWETFGHTLAITGNHSFLFHCFKFQNVNIHVFAGLSGGRVSDKIVQGIQLMLVSRMFMTLH